MGADCDKVAHGALIACMLVALFAWIGGMLFCEWLHNRGIMKMPPLSQKNDRHEVPWP